MDDPRWYSANYTKDVDEIESGTVCPNVIDKEGNDIIVNESECRNCRYYSFTMMDAFTLEKKVACYYRFEKNSSVSRLITKLDNLTLKIIQIMGKSFRTWFSFTIFIMNFFIIMLFDIIKPYGFMIGIMIAFTNTFAMVRYLKKFKKFIE